MYREILVARLTGRESSAILKISSLLAFATWLFQLSFQLLSFRRRSSLSLFLTMLFTTKAEKLKRNLTRKAQLSTNQLRTLYSGRLKEKTSFDWLYNHLEGLWVIKGKLLHEPKGHNASRIHQIQSILRVWNTPDTYVKRGLYFDLSYSDTLG